MYKGVVSWKTGEEKRAMRERLWKKGFGVFDHCVGIADGTLIAFKNRPARALEADEFFNYRKQEYGLQATVVCDDECRIPMFNAQFPGAVHDSRAWRQTSMFKHP
jgi:hypothetical protein